MKYRIKIPAITHFQKVDKFGKKTLHLEIICTGILKCKNKKKQICKTAEEIKRPTK